jgi:hypothetical protein
MKKHYMLSNNAVVVICYFTFVSLSNTVFISIATITTIYLFTIRNFLKVWVDECCAIYSFVKVSFIFN